MGKGKLECIEGTTSVSKGSMLERLVSETKVGSCVSLAGVMFLVEMD